MLTLHHLEQSRSQRILWLLEELGLPYAVQHYARDPQTLLAPAALRALHPLGKSPLVTDGDEVLAESGAIIDTLVARHGAGLGLAPPEGTPERQRYTYWLHYAEGSAMPPLLLSLIFRRMRSAPAPFFARPIVRKLADKVMASFVSPQLALHMGWIESELAKHPYFAGEAFSAADIQMGFPLEAAAARGAVTPEAHPAIHAWLARVQARPAYQRAQAKAGPAAPLG